MAKVKLEWEDIDNRNSAGYVRRAKVFGGWLIEYTQNVIHDTNGRLDSGWDWRTSVTFVPDPKHEWREEDAKDNEETKETKK